MAAHEAWSLVCRLFSGGGPVLRAALSPTEVRASALLGAAIKPTVVNRSFALCPYCQLRNGQIFADDTGGQFCLCSDCGRIALAPDDGAAVTLDENWLRSRLRMAMDIESRDGVTDLVDGVWRLGDARREPVLLSRSLARLWAEPAIFERVRASGAGIRVIAPQSPQTRGAPFPPGIAWLPLSSGKPNDLFKVKQRYKGDPDYEGPLYAYRALVKANRREGTYWTPCAGGASGSA